MVHIEDLDKVNILTPPALLVEQAIGYETQEPVRFVAFYWGGGDEAYYDDGHIGGTGNWPAYLEWVRFPPNALRLAPYNLGSSDFPAEHWLILDRETRQTYVAPVAIASDFLHQQWPQSEPEPMTPEELLVFNRRLTEALNRVMGTIPAPSNEEIMAALQRDHERLLQLHQWLHETWARLNAFGHFPEEPADVCAETPTDS